MVWFKGLGMISLEQLQALSRFIGVEVGEMGVGGYMGCHFGRHSLVNAGGVDG